MENQIAAADAAEKERSRRRTEKICCAEEYCQAEGACACKHVSRSAGEKKDTSDAFGAVRLAFGAALFAAALLPGLPPKVKAGVFAASALLTGIPSLLGALKNLFCSRHFDENFLMCLAAACAFAVGEYPEGAAVLLLFQVGERLEGLAAARSKRSIAALMDIRPDFANLKSDGGIERVPAEEVRPGELIVVKPGERIPLDGRVVEGRSALDMSALTGESVPREVGPGDGVLSGSVNLGGLLAVEVEKALGDSAASRIIALVESAASKKAVTETAIRKFARYYTPAVVAAAGLIAFIPAVAFGADLGEWIHRALVFLVASCPCALVISVPLAYVGGIGGASRSGILIKGSNFLDALSRVDTVVFDKTGTLTKGVFKVTHVFASGDADPLEYAAHAEMHSTHPVAASIREAYSGAVDPLAVADVSEEPGLGVRATVKGRNVLAGSLGLMEREGVEGIECAQAGSTVHVAVDGKYAGYIAVSDEVREGSHHAVRRLKRLGVRKIAMLTGDNISAAEKVGRELGLDEVRSNLLPEQKVAELGRLDGHKAAGGKLVFVGDGINDAPVLARADVGVAMGQIGSDAAIEAADVVLMTDELSRLADAIEIAKKTRRIVWENIVFALLVKGAVLALGAVGAAAMWEAVLADVGVALLAVINSSRALGGRRVEPESYR